MIRIVFNGADGRIDGFQVSGHGTADGNDFEGSIVCAAVSSAVYLTVNTLTEIIGAKVSVSDSGDEFKVAVLSDSSKSQPTLQGLRLHCTALCEQYPKRMKIYSEV